MAKSNDELLAIRDESYRVVHVEVCRTCRHWQRLRASEDGLCIIVNAGDVLWLTNAFHAHRETSPLGTCDSWEGQKSDK